MKISAYMAALVAVASLLGACATATVGPAKTDSDGWVHYETIDAVPYYYDPSSVKKTSENMVRVRFKQKLPPLEEFDENEFAPNRTTAHSGTIEFNCELGKFRTVEFSNEYSKRNSERYLPLDNKVTWFDLYPSKEKLFKAVCR